MPPKSRGLGQSPRKNTHVGQEQQTTPDTPAITDPALAPDEHGIHSQTMTSETSALPSLPLDDFARRFSMRGRNLMWFLGAGASAAAGIPTATDMIWEFKQRLFVSQRRASPQSVADLSNPVVRSQLQSHVDASGNAPAPGSPNEYAVLFEMVYPSESDRRAYLDSKMNGAKASFGHMALATLARAKLAPLIWTTNFDPLIADACAKVYGNTGALSSVALDAPELAEQLIGDQRWPIEVKLHGDFRSRQLKNTDDELRHQDARLRQILVDCCRRFGLVVAGYSGRDDSIVKTLNDALDHPGAFPGGLFWLQRHGSEPLVAVTDFLTRAVGKGVEAALVPVENFDETLRDIMRLQSGVDTQVLDTFSKDRQRWSSPPPLTGNPGWPVVRLNAIEIDPPTVCRRVICQIGGHKEARAAVVATGGNVLVGRVRAGVLAFGSDSDVRAAFGPHDISEFDLHTIEKRRLRYDSGERGLLYAALVAALARQCGLRAIRRWGTYSLVPANVSDPTWMPLTALVGALNGSIKGHPELSWTEGVEIHLDWADERLWLLFDSRCVFEGTTPETKGLAADFARERTVKRYNTKLNQLMDFWSNLLAPDESRIQALGVGDGVDASFKLVAPTAFSRRRRG